MQGARGEKEGTRYGERMGGALRCLFASPTGVGRGCHCSHPELDCVEIGRSVTGRQAADRDFGLARDDEMDVFLYLKKRGKVQEWGALRCSAARK